ncbi:MAG: hypothetical protein HXX08_02805 [Chloroflexi bacterium]|uniref:Uncharacterized protein n=1 Tax=Candidatus Chlorohelix allophototropha TaxID=3003348 RepID=A0A8T7M2P9_9CHLR|nr:hypothetical protein [Chloroflexota bacterium]WJW66668.1 hypothetical protein OZ401_002480 [Chloroflexota bacterium L227-S17]
MQLMIAAQFQGTLPEIQQKMAKVAEIFYPKDIYYQLEAIPKMMRFKVLVYSDDLTKAKDALFGIFPNEPRKLQVQVDSQVPLKLSKNVIKPGQTALFGRLPFALKIPGSEAFQLDGDNTIALNEFAVEWDGFGTLRIRDLGEGIGVVVGEVMAPANEWLQIETGAKVRIGRQAVLRFVEI